MTATHAYPLGWQDRTDNERRAMAAHEAGHAWQGFLEDVPFTDVGFRDRADTPASVRFEELNSVPDSTYVRIMVAGSVADHLLAPGLSGLGAELNDRGHVLQRLGDADVVADAWADQSYGLLLRYQYGVERKALELIVDAMLTRPTQPLTFAQMHSLVGAHKVATLRNVLSPKPVAAKLWSIDTPDFVCASGELHRDGELYDLVCTGALPLLIGLFYLEAGSRRINCHIVHVRHQEGESGTITRFRLHISM